ncbi:15839_t:CDS:2 [Acaulospora morrowiae]|uniref:15839_t:CDS:1 n=1 Tax=Acaulospora morrowiae TaxID=94023 RepID=A0A9N9IET8_9GLOM|nr:15839_t:CDS:2 [Acaulospora morrowiae]
MVMPNTNLDDSQSPLLDQNGIQPTEQSLQIPTLTGPTKINMSFIFSLVASSGVFLFAGTVWYIVFDAEYEFFIWHPTLMALVLLSITQGVLVLQTAVRKEEREKGLLWHKIIQTVVFLSVIGGFTIIYTHKSSTNKEHFTSPHGKFGVFTFVYLLFQTVGGSILANFPGLVGGAAKARGLYKYHRISGYVLVSLVYLTALGGTQTDWA